MVGAGALALWLLAGCSASDEGAQANVGVCDSWCSGGQTGSLIPSCGITPNAMMRGVPASAAGIVVSADECGDARLFDALTVRDASGRPIAFTTEQLPNGEILIHPNSGLTPGSYTVSVPAAGVDEDAGVESSPDASEPVSTTLWQQTVTVQPSMPLPRLFGTLGREQYGCDVMLELRPEAAVLPYLGLLSVDIQVNDGAARTLIKTGTMKLVNGVTRVQLPEDLHEGLPDGEHTLHVSIKLAGEAAPLETYMLTLSVPCDVTDSVYYMEESDGCTAIAPGGASAPESVVASAFALLAIALRKRRRAAR
jgi:hypothetical protein